MKHAAIVAGVFLGLAMPALLTAGQERPGAQGREAASDSEAPSPGSGGGRLRFRDGPVCMCSLGLSEEDIQRSNRDRRDGGEQRESGR